MKNISIEKSSCIKCGKCVLVCPSMVMTQQENGSEVGLQHIESCIACGHCVDVCPTGSVLHSLFPPEKQHLIDYSQMPTPEQVMLLIKSRRSNRAITSEAIPHEVLNQIIEAALCAPTASNKQQLEVVVVSCPDKLKEISGFTVDVFSSVAKKLNNPLIKGVLKPFMGELYAQLPAFVRLQSMHDAGKDPILRKSTTLLVFHTPKSSRFGCEDANLAYQNASLMAQSLCVSQIYMGFVMAAIKQNGKSPFTDMLGKDRRVYAIMALGIPAFNYSKYSDKK